MLNYLSRTLLIFTLLPLLLLGSCDTPTETTNYERPREAWVFRSVLDKKARMLTLALSENLWVAYDAQNCGIYRAWQKGVLFDGPVYTTAHGPQPTSIGAPYFSSDIDNPWFAVKDGKAVQVKPHYKGHKLSAANQATLMYELELEDGTLVQVEETPEFEANEENNVGLQRTYLLSNVPAGVQISLRTRVGAILTEKNIKVEGGSYQLSEKKNKAINGVGTFSASVVLMLKANGKTTFTTYFYDKVAESEPVAKEIVLAELEGPELMERTGCNTCHNVNKKTVGPALVDIAKKYAYTQDNIDYLVAKVKNGGAGVWGQAAMIAHPDLPELLIENMTHYIMGLDKEQFAQQPVDSTDLRGLAVTAWKLEQTPNKLPAPPEGLPMLSVSAPMVHFTGGDFPEQLDNNFLAHLTGILKVEYTNNYVFRLVSDDGAKLYMDGRLIIDNDGLHGPDPKDGELEMQAGHHEIKIEYFQGTGGKYLSLQWAPHGSGKFEPVPSRLLSHSKSQLATEVAVPDTRVRPYRGQRIPGQGYPLEEVHPSFTLFQARPDDFKPKVGGMDFYLDGRLAVCTWEAAGPVYVVSNPEAENPADIKVEQIASGLAEPLGLKIVDDELYVLQKQELTRLKDTDGDGKIDLYETVCNGWRVSPNFHEFAFGLVYKDGYFYAALATAIEPGGASTQPQIQDRGKVVKINPKDGSFEFIASGLRTPNGIGLGPDNEIYLADNQGDWLPASKIMKLEQGAFYGSRSVNPIKSLDWEVTPPVVWLTQNEIGNSPSQPTYLNLGPYENQLIYGEVTHGGLKRVFLDPAGDVEQGAVFRFTQGLEAGINRVVWSPNGNSLYVGGVGSTGNWGHEGKLEHGLQRLEWNGIPAFEMLAVRAMSNGMEIELTEPLKAGDGWNKDAYQVKQWYFKPTADYGGPKMDERELPIRSVNVSDDRRKIFLELDGMKDGHVVYTRLMAPWVSENDNPLWTTEAWYTLNKIPDGKRGFRTSAPSPVATNTLSPQEKAEGWELLFDGKTTNGWRKFKGEKVGSAWRVENGTLALNGKREDWQFIDGGDIITDQEFENYELSLEWKLAPGGNSGIIYNVIESDEYDYVWQTGPEMQVLDNARHPDAKIFMHRAGDLYDMIPSKAEAVKPAGEWNRVRLVVQNGHVEHWLNGQKVVEFQMWDDNWKQMVANSKFGEMPGFGTGRKGHIALQDHGDPVFYRNIKIKRLPAGDASASR